VRNVELMWLMGRLYPDHKSIAEFRRMHRESGHSERSRVGAVRALGGPDSRRMDRRRWY
jgi:hypothetical protein